MRQIIKALGITTLFFMAVVLLFGVMYWVEVLHQLHPVLGGCAIMAVMFAYVFSVVYVVISIEESKQ